MTSASGFEDGSGDMGDRAPAFQSKITYFAFLFVKLYNALSALGRKK